MPYYGIDVSDYQGHINWHRVKQAGIDFMATKVSEGLGGWHASAQRNLAGAKSAGIEYRCGYHYVRSSDGRAQADNFLNRLRAVNGGTLDGVGTMIDCEKGSTWPAIQACAHRITQVTGRDPMIYTGRYFWQSLGNHNGAALGPLWHSRYLDYQTGTLSSLLARMPKSDWTPGYGGWTEAMVFQFTSSGRVEGVPTNVDGDAIRRPLGDLAEYFGHPVTPLHKPNQPPVEPPIVIKPPTPNGADELNDTDKAQLTHIEKVVDHLNGGPLLALERVDARSRVLDGLDTRLDDLSAKLEALTASVAALAPQAPPAP